MTSAKHRPTSRQVAAHFAHRELVADDSAEITFAAHLANTFSSAERLDLYGRHITGLGPFDALMRRVLVRSLVRKMGHAVVISPGVQWIHPQTFELGDGAFIGSQAILQGRHDGQCKIGNRVWIGPGAYLDARDQIGRAHV